MSSSVDKYNDTINNVKQTLLTNDEEHFNLSPFNNEQLGSDDDLYNSDDSFDDNYIYSIITKRQKYEFKKPTLVLDLDQTLIHCIETTNSTKIKELSTKKNLLTYYESNNVHLFIYYRPYLFDFLIKMNKIYELIVYTNATKSYTDIVITSINIKLGYQPIQKCYTRHNNILFKYLRSVDNINIKNQNYRRCCNSLAT